MKIVETYSHLNGLEFLLVHEKEMWKEIENVINSIDAKKCGEIAIFSYNQTDFVKNRVAIEVQFGKYSFVAYDLFVKHLAFYMGNKIDVGIEILPMKSLQAKMSSGIAYYEGELYNVARQGRGIPSVPIVIIGIEP